jgi:lipopolysaccharide export system permease protein
MHLVCRYLLKEIFGYFFVSLTIFVGLLFTLRVLKFSNLVINRGVDVSQIASVFIAIIPTFLEFALPMACVLGVLLAFARLSGDSELIVLRASGISLYRLIVPVLLFGLSITLFGFVVSSYLRPWGYRALDSALFEIARSKTTSGLSEGIFNKLGSITLYPDKVDYQSGELTRVLIDDRRVPEARKIISAARGLIDSDPSNRRISFYLREGAIHELVNGTYVLTEFQKNTLSVEPEDLSVGNERRREKPAKEMYSSELSAAIQQRVLSLQDTAESASPEADRSLERAAAALRLANGGSAVAAPPSRKELQSSLNKLRTEQARRAAFPFAALTLALLAMPLGVHSPRTQRTWGIGLSTTFGLLVFIFYFITLSVGVTLAENGRISPQIALWAPNLLCLLLAVFLLRRICSERWQSATEFIERLRLPGFLRRRSSP